MASEFCFCQHSGDPGSIQAGRQDRTGHATHGKHMPHYPVIAHLDKPTNNGKILPLWKYIKMKTKSQTHTKLAAGQFIELLQCFIRLQPNWVMPEHIVRFKQQMEKLRGSGNSEEHTFLLRVFMILAHSKTPLTMGELSAALKVPLSSATRIVDWLVRGNFLERTY